MSLYDDLYVVGKKDIKSAVNVISDAFSGDPMWSTVYNNEKNNRIVTEGMVRFCLKYGSVRATSGKLEGIMTITPHDKDMSMWRVIQSGTIFLMMRALSEVTKMKVLGNTINDAKKSLNLGPHIHLMTLGVAQEYQGQGFGGKLLRALIEKAELEGKPLYLETQKEENVSLYEKYGFSVKKKIIIPEPLNLPMWLMFRSNN
jgi:ribosomal protein S18 acetylase RimI-like enzyme